MYSNERTLQQNKIKYQNEQFTQKDTEYDSAQKSVEITLNRTITQQ